MTKEKFETTVRNNIPLCQSSKSAGAGDIQTMFLANKENGNLIILQGNSYSGRVDGVEIDFEQLDKAMQKWLRLAKIRGK